MPGLDFFSVYAGGVIVSTFFMAIITLTGTLATKAQKVWMVLVPPFWPLMLPLLFLSAIVQRANTNKYKRAPFKGRNNDRNFH